MKSILAIFVMFFCINKIYAGNNIHLIDQDPQTGFQIYRFSEPDKKDMKMLCDLGIDEVMVLSGNAKTHEYKYQDKCPSLKVIYDEDQSAKVPLTGSFLRYFDNWVHEAKATGKKIAFRCECGCHRTGRLAAYYQMKYQNITPDDAVAIMNKHGKYMWLHPQLEPQVNDLANYIKDEPCNDSKKYCVVRD
ncbi:MAG: dual specificity protein phosphatase family protein [Bacteriovoracaceae bacterium]